MKLTVKIIVASITVALCGCMAKVVVDRRPNIALPVYSSNSSTNPVEYVIVDQGYMVKYSKFGFNTDIQSMEAEITTNRTVKFSLGGLHSNVATNTFSIRLDELLKLSQLVRNSTNDVIVIDKNKILGERK